MCVHAGYKMARTPAKLRAKICKVHSSHLFGAHVRTHTRACTNAYAQCVYTRSTSTRHPTTPADRAAEVVAELGACAGGGLAPGDVEALTARVEALFDAAALQADLEAYANAAWQELGPTYLQVRCCGRAGHRDETGVHRKCVVIPRSRPVLEPAGRQARRCAANGRPPGPPAKPASGRWQRG
jgi:hypothetical protein